MQRAVATAGVLAVLLGAAAAVLTVLAPPPEFRYLAPTAAVAFGATAALVALRGRAAGASTAALILALVGLSFGISAVARTYVVLALPRDLPLALPALWLGGWTFAPTLVVLAAVLPLLLPEGRLPSPRWRPALALSLVVVVANAVFWSLNPIVTEAAPGRLVPNPLGVPAIAGLEPVVAAPTALAVLLALSSLVVRWRRGTPVERQQLKWLGLGVGISVGLWVVSAVLPPDQDWIAILYALPLPACIAVAALRHRLWDVDVVISRTLVVGVLTALVVGGSAVLAGFLGPAGSVVALLLVLAVQGPVRRLVNHLVHGEADDPATALTRLGGRLEATEQPLSAVVARLAELLRSPYVGLRSADGDLVESGARPAFVEVVALRHHGSTVGALELSPRTRTERARVELLAPQAAVAVHTALLARDLRRTRHLAVTAREEERRRLRRDLHDGLGPVLAALGLQAETARDLLPSDPAAARALLDRMVPLLSGTVADVRTLVHDLRPPTLDELGLEGAVRELAARFGGPDLAIGCEIEQLGALPAAVDVAAYRIVAEALANACRHAAATTVSVAVRRDDSWLHLTVHDDGRGIPADAARGLGLRSMSLRAEELDGVCEVRSGPGTLVRARLPLDAAP
jgi:two-component system, NarL family, sensor kinase